jgi:transcriptional regulator with XRE-family HTH domain
MLSFVALCLEILRLTIKALASTCKKKKQAVVLYCGVLYSPRMDNKEKLTLPINAVVAYNLRRARESKGWSQDQATGAVGLYLGLKWSRQMLSAAERAYDGKSNRQFSINEIFAFARGFGVPVAYFYEPPPGVWFFSTAPASTRLVDGVLKPGAKPSEGEPFRWDSFPVHEMPGLLGNPETPVWAAKVRALLQEMEGS